MMLYCTVTQLLEYLSSSRIIPGLFKLKNHLSRLFFLGKSSSLWVNKTMNIRMVLKTWMDWDGLEDKAPEVIA